MSVIGVVLVAALSTITTSEITEKSLLGTYRMSTGFEIYALELRQDGTAVYTYRPDHPGGSNMNGKWSFDGTVVDLRLVSAKRKPKKGYGLKLVPVHWGERQYLVYEEEIRDFAGMAMRWEDAHLDERSQRSEMYRAPLMKTSDFKYKKRFGTPKAPAKYVAWFQWGT